MLFTLPLILGNVFQQLYSVVDTLLVGRFLGVEALAAVGCTGSILFLVFGFINGATTGITIKTGQYYGAKDEVGVRKSAATCVYIAALIAFIITVAGVFGARPLLVLMKTPPEILDNAVMFITVICGGITMTVFFFFLTNIIRVLGDSSTPTKMLAYALVLNIILEPIILLWLEWGIPGAALGTLIGQFVGNLGCLWHIKKKVPALHIQKSDWHVTKKDIIEHLKIGLPMGFQTAVVALGTIIVQVALNRHGAVAVAAFSAAQKVDMIATMPMMSFGMTMAAYTAQNYGARHFERIKEGVKSCAMMSCGFAIVMGVVIYTLGPSMMRLFVGDGEPLVIEYGQTVLVMTSVAYCALALMFIFRYTLQGLGQSTVPTVAGFMELIMRFLAAIYLADWYGYVGVCLATPLAWVASALPLVLAWFQTKNTLHDAHPAHA